MSDDVMTAIQDFEKVLDGHNGHPNLITSGDVEKARAALYDFITAQETAEVVELRASLADETQKWAKMFEERGNASEHFRHEAARLAEYAEQFKADALRYRFLRDNFANNDWGTGSINFGWNAPMGGGGSLEATLAMFRKSLDDAIDALSKNTVEVEIALGPDDKWGAVRCSRCGGGEFYQPALSGTDSRAVAVNARSGDTPHVERGPGFEAFRWTGDQRTFEAAFGQTCPVDAGEKLSVPSGTPGQFLRVWCGSWVIRRKDGKCFVLSDDNYRYAQEEWHAFPPYAPALPGVGSSGTANATEG